MARLTPHRQFAYAAAGAKQASATLVRQPLLEALLPDGHDAAFLTTSKHAQACGLNPKKVFRCIAHADQLGLSLPQKLFQPPASPPSAPSSGSVLSVPENYVVPLTLLSSYALPPPAWNLHQEPERARVLRQSAAPRAGHMRGGLGSPGSLLLRQDR